MDQKDYTTNHLKGKHLNYEERVIIELRLKDNWSIPRIAKELDCAENTVRNEIKRGIVYLYNGSVQRYKAKAGQKSYINNRKNSRKPYKILHAKRFIDWVSENFKNPLKKWSLDASYGRAMLENKFSQNEMVCTKTLYNYVDLSLIPIKNIDLPEKLKRKKKEYRVRKNKRILGESIESRPAVVSERKEFGHWEVDTVIGKKSGEHEVLLTLVELISDKTIVIKLSSKTSEAVKVAFDQLKEMYSWRFNEIFKSITSDNGSEFSELSMLKSEGTAVYFTHPYTSCERPVNERHNGILRRFIPKGKQIEDFSVDEIGFIEDWVNQLPRKILGYRTPEEVFDEKLDIIYTNARPA